MKTIKKILFPLFSLFLGYRSYELVRSLITSAPNDYSNNETLLLSFLLSLFITGVFAFIGFVYPSNKLLPDSYYKIKNPEVLSAICKVLGVKYFQVLLLFTFWGRKSNRAKFFNGTKSGLKNFVYQTKQSEFGHLGAFLVILILSFVLLFYAYYFLVISLTLINIIGNAYPIFLQRSHRIRIEKIIA